MYFTNKQKVALGACTIFAVIFVAAYFVGKWYFGKPSIVHDRVGAVVLPPPDPPLIGPRRPSSALSSTSATLPDSSENEQPDAVTPNTSLPPPDATENVQNDKEPSETFDIMLLSPEEMLTYLEETYTPQEQLDFLTSETGVHWIHSKLAPNFPIIDASYLDECFELYPVDSPERAPCLENRQRELFAPHVRSLGEGIQNVVEFLNQLSTEFHQVGVQGAGASILPPPDPPQARIRSVE